MSRSRKKVAMIKGGGSGKKAKSFCNRKVRHNSTIVSGNYYRRVGCRYDIYDYVFVPNHRYTLTKEMNGVDWEDKKDYVSK